MGSWANSLHVRHDDPDAIINAIKALKAEGLADAEVLECEPALADDAPTPRSERLGLASPSMWDDEDDDVPDDLDDDFDADDGDSEFDEEPQGRRLSVFKPVNGWVGILDNDLGGAATLAEQLSKRLRTDTLLVYVNDSDAWGYGLYRHGVRLDEFDSSGDTSGDDSMASPELEDAIARGDEEAVAEIIAQQTMAFAPEGSIVMPDGSEMIPPHIVMIKQRMSEGKAGFFERWRYRLWWIKFLYRAFTGKIGGGEFGFDIPRTVPLDEATLSRHIDQISGFFSSADAVKLRELLPKSRFPAESLLVDFLNIIGLPGLYGHLSYDYQRDYSRREMAREGIVYVGDVQFEE